MLHDPGQPFESKHIYYYLSVPWLKLEVQCYLQKRGNPSMLHCICITHYCSPQSTLVSRGQSHACSSLLRVICLGEALSTHSGAACRKGSLTHSWKVQCVNQFKLLLNCVCMCVCVGVTCFIHAVCMMGYAGYMYYDDQHSTVDYWDYLILCTYSEWCNVHLVQAKVMHTCIIYDGPHTTLSCGDYPDGPQTTRIRNCGLDETRADIVIHTHWYKRTQYVASLHADMQTNM